MERMRIDIDDALHLNDVVAKCRPHDLVQLSLELGQYYQWAALPGSIPCVSG